MRARNLKPGFFKNENLADLEPLARILFSGLWCYADREGRFEWRPKRIKIEILPYDECDPETLLAALCKKGFVVKYSVNGNEYGFLPKFLEHQKPHKQETKSKIPSLDGTNEEQSQTKVRITSSQGTNNIEPNSEVVRLNPSSLNPSSLNPSSLNPESKDESSKEDLSSEVSSDEKFPEILICPHLKIVDLYHEILPQCPQVKEWGPESQKNLRARWKAKKERQDLLWWRQYFEYVRGSPFLTGQKTDFVATLGWLVRPRNMEKVLNGQYHHAADNEMEKHRGILEWLKRKQDEQGRTA